MKISLCITVFNEEKHISGLLESIVQQTRQPDEVVIVDGGSTDTTVSVISNFIPIKSGSNKQIKILSKKGNRAVGRNEAIRQAAHEIIAITDAGCALDSHWLEEITKPFQTFKVAVVSGYYKGKPKNALEASLVPYVLVMPDKIDSDHFLPATRSMAMRKSVWEKLGGFPEKYRWNEDYVFSKSIEKAGIPIAFAQKAIVYWFPRENIIDGWKMFYAFARGDTQAGIWRVKVVFLLFRVILGLILIFVAWVTHSLLLWMFILLGMYLYLVWAIMKNYRYVRKPMAILYLPLWQLVSDTAVCIGSIVGYFEKVK